MSELKNLYVNDRTILVDRIPFKIPLCISIEPTNICNFKCVMCFHGNNELAEEAKPLKSMDMETFNKIIADIKAWVEECGEKVKLIKLYSLGEPLLNGNICEMLRIIKKENICEKVEITTNASLLSKDIAEKFVEYGLDVFRVSVYGVDNESNRKVTQSNVTVEDIFENVKFLKEHRDQCSQNSPKIYAKMFRTYSEMDDKFIELYGSVVDEIGFDEPFNLNSGDANIFENLYGDQAGEMFGESVKTNLYNTEKACRYPFTHMTIRNDGSIIVCCSDWLKELKYGKIDELTLKEAWEGKALYDIRCGMVKTKGKCFNACSQCEIPFRDLPEDNIDDLDLSKITYVKR